MSFLPREFPSANSPRTSVWTSRTPRIWLPVSPLSLERMLIPPQNLFFKYKERRLGGSMTLYWSRACSATSASISPPTVHLLGFGVPPDRSSKRYYPTLMFDTIDQPNSHNSGLAGAGFAQADALELGVPGRALEKLLYIMSTPKFPRPCGVCTKGLV